MADTTRGRNEVRVRPLVAMALVSLLLCGLFFPLLITGIAQVALPYQANGEVVQLDGRPVGSALIAQGFNQSIFFQPRNDSASGVDPDITVQDAYSQIPRISSASGIPASTLQQLVDQNTDGQSRVFGEPYVNVLTLNLALINAYPSVYGQFR
ncbi:MAG: potassium-transporting ATPase subunit C [Nitrososphaerales archaeon]|nr:potassium-transporting ATPase subunit C [Nitrososphaerales archaeon]